MLDNVLIQMIIKIIESNAAIAGVPGLLVKAAYQPTRQGIAVPPTVYLSKIGDHRLGYPYQPKVWGGNVSSSFQGSIAGKVLTVASISSGKIVVGTTLSGTNIDPGSMWVTALGSGTGGTGTYILNQGFTLAQQAISGIAGMQNATTQQYETTFQIMALATQNPSTPNQYTASDVLNAVAYILQSDLTVAILESNGIGILRVTDIRNPPFVDDRDRFEYGPSFDFTLTHKQVITSQVPILQSEEVQVYEI